MLHTHIYNWTRLWPGSTRWTRGSPIFSKFPGDPLFPLAPGGPCIPDGPCIPGGPVEMIVTVVNFHMHNKLLIILVYTLNSYFELTILSIIG